MTSSKVDFLNFMDEDGKADELCSFVDSIDVDDEMLYFDWFRQILLSLHYK